MQDYMTVNFSKNLIKIKVNKMHSYTKILILTVTLLLGTGCSMFETAPELNAGMVNSLPIKNLTQQGDNAFSGGQPSQVDFSIMKDGGIQHVVNLRPSSEADWNEKEVVDTLGMSYHQLEIAGVDDINVANARQLGALIKGFDNEAYFIHCASGNRVGALIAINEALVNGKDIEQAIEMGKQWGLTKLEPQVRAVITSQ
jgi:protein tyrosine phosphatase (PTP) superfamily phosphohydrolase (DUF442 family)